jgi:ankyrin repeat protein
MMQTPLILAALTKQTQVVRRLMVAGADIEKADRHGDTALHIACRNGDLHMLKQITKPVSTNEMRMNPCKYKSWVQRIPQDLNARNYDGKGLYFLS